MTSPYVLLPYQQRWINDQSPVKVWAKSRRIGASWCEAADAVLQAGAARGMDVLYISYNREISRQWCEDAAAWAKHFHVAASGIEEGLFPDGDDGTKSILGYRLTFASGHDIVALSSRPTNLRGRAGICVIDEAGFVDDLGALLKAAIAFLMWQGKIRILSTFNGIDDAFTQLVENCRMGKVPYSLHETNLDQAIQDGLFKRICEVSGQSWSPEAEAAWRQWLFDLYPDEAAALEELMCVPRSGTGSYISRPAIEQCMVEGRPVIRLALSDDFLHQSESQREAFIDGWIDDELREHLNALSPNARHVLGQDFGRSGDLSDIAPATEGEDLAYHVPFITELRNVPFEAQRQILFAICDRLPHFTRASLDAGGNGSYLAETCQQRYYGKVDAIKFTEQFYTTHMPQLRDALENRRLTLPRHADILRDLRQIELIRGIPKVDANKRQTGSDGKPRHADAAIALLLAWYAANEGGAPAGGSIVTQQSPHYQSLHSGLFGRLR